MEISETDRNNLLSKFYIYHHEPIMRVPQDYVELCDCRNEGDHLLQYHTTIAEDEICLLCGHYVRVENIHTTQVHYRTLPNLQLEAYQEELSDSLPPMFPPTAQWVHENKGKHGLGDLRDTYMQALKELDFDMEKCVKCFKAKSEKSLINFLRMQNIYRTETGFTRELVNPHLSRSKSDR